VVVEQEMGEKYGVVRKGGWSGRGGGLVWRPAAREALARAVGNPLPEPHLVRIRLTASCQCHEVWGLHHFQKGLRSADSAVILDMEFNPTSDSESGLRPRRDSDESTGAIVGVLVHKQDHRQP
jgi:hypothetical protein